VAGLIIFILSITGCALVFQDDIDRLLNRDLTVVTPAASTASLQTAVEAVRRAYPSETPTGLILPEKPHHALLVALQNGQNVSVDQYSGRILGARGRLSGFARELRRFHKSLMAGPTGQTIVGALTFLTLLMAGSGVILWWPRRILGVKSGRSWRRVNWDLHNVLGFYSAAFLAVMCVSGVMITFADTIDPLVLRLDSTPPRGPAPLASRVGEGGIPIGPDEAWRLGRSTLPGALVARMNLPPPGTSVYRLQLKFPEDRTPGGRSAVALDQYSGEVLDVENSRTAGPGTKILNVKATIHTGEVFGAPSEALAFVVSLMLAGQVVTGFLIWWRPAKFRFAARSRRAKAPASIREPA
jgi:uncharacterized iron-regulated membrane protein